MRTTHTDRELLELVAKAAGIECWYQAGLQYFGPRTRPIHWNPLTDDGDALRLAVKLNLIIGAYETYSSVSETYDRPKLATAVAEFICWHHENADDPYAATRRAIVRVAAAIGKAMP